MAKDVKVGVSRAGGPPPGYRWAVHILNEAFDEVMKFLNEDQHSHSGAPVQGAGSGK